MNKNISIFHQDMFPTCRQRDETTNWN